MSQPQAIAKTSQRRKLMSGMQNQPLDQPQTMNPQMAQQQQQQQQQLQQLGGVQAQIQDQQAPGQLLAGMQQPACGRERQTIWSGLLEWMEKKRNSDGQRTSRSIPCQVSAFTTDDEPELRADDWPSELWMQLMPKHVIGSIDEEYFLKNSKSVLLNPQPCEALDALTRVMSSGFDGCVHFTSQPTNACELKVLILLYSAEERAYLGIIPNDQTAFVEHLRKVILHQRSTQGIQRGQTGGPGMAPVGPSPGLGPAMSQMQAPMQQQQQAQQQQQQQQQQGMMTTSQTNPMVTGGVQLTQNNVPGQIQPQMTNIGQQRPQMNVQPGLEAGVMSTGQQPGVIRTQGMMPTQQAGLVIAEAMQQQQQEP
ncbi:mediator of RNA polymerase II transcription subunit 25-like [Cloeon dipterum]|uniref:mediator of RNA polymerase II transcription subunit 25-like n=1 Tax=Cloeon dipterum TaxID=197152 RepID=UPI00321FE808